jgi:pimeloyl-ACP methyl ester carboxylesterase
MQETHNTAATQFVSSEGIRFAYRRFGKQGSVPLVLIQHFMGNLDNFDPAVTDGLAQGREVILFDNTGVGQSDGQASDTIEGMARDAASFIDGLGLTQVDLFGHSMGGHVAQQLLVDRPDLVRRAVLVGTGPRGGEGMATPHPEVAALFSKQYDPQDQMWLPIMFAPTPTSQAAGRKWLERIRSRTVDRDLAVSAETIGSHWAAAQKWGQPGPDSYSYLESVEQPVLVVNGHNDIIIATINSFILQQNLPDAELVIYPDSNHGSQFQFAEQFVGQVSEFLDR